MPSYCVKALENTQSILCGLFLVCEHFCSGRTASHRTALDFRGIFVLLDAGGLSPAKDKRAKSTEKTGCPTCVLLLIDAFPFVYKTSRLRWRRDVFVYSCLALARSTPRKYSLVILNITGLSAKSAMKFGIAIRPLSVSAMFQTKSSEETLPTTIMIMKTN